MHGTCEHFAPFLDACPPTFEALPIEYPTDQVLGYAELVSLVLERLPQDKPFVLLGESFSGPLAVLIGARKPKGLAGVVLAASFVSSPRCPCIRFLPWRLIFSFSPPRFALRALAGEDGDPKLLDLLSEMSTRVKPAVLAARMAEVCRVRAEDALKELQAPVLYLRATQDRVVPATAARHIQAIKPEATIAEIEGPHLILQTRPRACWEAIQRFAESLT